MKTEKVKMKTNLFNLYCNCEELKGEIDLVSKEDATYLKTFLLSISGADIEIVRTHGDAFEVKENDTWLPDCLFDPA